MDENLTSELLSIFFINSKEWFHMLIKIIFLSFFL